MAKRDAPATQRNREPIRNVLDFFLREPARVLEVASGSGQHAAFFARSLPHLTWQPSERSPESFSSIEAWGQEHSLENWRPPVELDATCPPWSVDRFEAIFNANMIHISPWDTTIGLLRGAAMHLEPSGLLILYGPYRVEGRHTSESNHAFDESLRDRDSSWGVRDLDLEAVIEVAAEQELDYQGRVAMPANNQVVVFRAK